MSNHRDCRDWFAEQIIDFDLDARIDPANTYLLGPDGNEVPYQFLDGGKKLAVRTDLPAGAEKTWRLLSGRAPAPVTDGVRVTETAVGSKKRTVMPPSRPCASARRA